MISSITNLSRGGIGRLVLAPETGLEMGGWGRNWMEVLLSLQLELGRAVEVQRR